MPIHVILAQALIVTDIFFTSTNFVEISAVEHQNHLFIVIPDLIWHDGE
jgi:hypothetical protein